MCNENDKKKTRNLVSAAAVAASTVVDTWPTAVDSCWTAGSPVVASYSAQKHNSCYGMCLTYKHTCNKNDTNYNYVCKQYRERPLLTIP